MNLTVPMFAGASLQTRQKQSPLAQSPHFASNSIAARQPLKSDVVALSKVHQPRFSAMYELSEAHRGTGSNHDPDRYSTQAKDGEETGQQLYSYETDKDYGFTGTDKRKLLAARAASDQLGSGTKPMETIDQLEADAVQNAKQPPKKKR